MVSERKSMLLNRMSCEQINEHVFKHHNYDGTSADADLQTIVSAEYGRRYLRKSTPIWLGMSAIGGYNLTRMGVLSNSGRMGAIGGLAFGAWMSVVTMRM